VASTADADLQDLYDELRGYSTDDATAGALREL
jgi:hypothetical protein